MSTLPAAGWYPTEHGMRWWNGQTWDMQTPTAHLDAQHITAHHLTPAQMPTQPRARRRIYPTNILRFRTLWFLAVGPIVGGALLSMLIPGLPITLTWFVLFAGLLWSSMSSQMACHHCGTALRVTRLSGHQDVCHKCGALTDKGEAQEAARAAEATMPVASSAPTHTASSTHGTANGGHLF